MTQKVKQADYLGILDTVDLKNIPGLSYVPWHADVVVLGLGSQPQDIVRIL